MWLLDKCILIQTLQLQSDVKNDVCELETRGSNLLDALTSANNM